MIKRSLTLIYFTFPLLIFSFFMSGISTVAYCDHAHKKSKKGKHHKEVYSQRQSGKILPFADVLKKVRPFIQGEIIETEFEMEDGIPIYEFKYINKKGHVLEMEVDARTGKILKVKRD